MTGGAELHIQLIKKYFSKKGLIIHTFYLYKTNKKDRQIYPVNNESITFLTNHKNIFLVIIGFIKQLIIYRKYNFDFIYTSHIHCSSLIGLSRKLNLLKADKHIVRESHSFFIRFRSFKLLIVKVLYLIGYSNIDLLICQSGIMQKQLFDGLPSFFSKIKTVVIPNPIDLSDIYNKSKNYNENIFQQPYLIAAGRLIKEKGFDILVKSFSQLTILYPDLNLIILGEGKERMALEKEVEELNLQEKIFLPGHFKNIYPYLKQAKLCVISSKIEGFPNTLLQMMALNTKVVSTLCAGGIEELKGVYTCQTNNDDALMKAMQDCLKADTRMNRFLFDKELEQRSVSYFVEKVKVYLNET